MAAAVPLHFFPPPDPPVAVAVEAEDRDQRFFLNDTAWEDYVALNDVLGDRSGARVCYCEGTVELVSFVRIPDQAAAARAYLKRLGETGR